MHGVTQYGHVHRECTFFCVLANRNEVPFSHCVGAAWPPPGVSAVQKLLLPQTQRRERSQCGHEEQVPSVPGIAQAPPALTVSGSMRSWNSPGSAQMHTQLLRRQGH